MALRTTRRSRRRQPKQRRSRQTVDAVLDAVVRVLKREGFNALTTNRIAEVAGVSIGSVYQYFPDKQAIFVALHQRHIEEIDRMVETKLIERAGSSLDDLVTAMIGGMIDTHKTDPELHQLLLTEVPHRADGTRDFAVRLHGAFLLAISSRARLEEAPRSRQPCIRCHTHGGVTLPWSIVPTAPRPFARRRESRGGASSLGLLTFIMVWRSSTRTCGQRTMQRFRSVAINQRANRSAQDTM